MLHQTSKCGHMLQCYIKPLSVVICYNDLHPDKKYIKPLSVVICYNHLHSDKLQIPLLTEVPDVHTGQELCWEFAYFISNPHKNLTVLTRKLRHKESR